MGPPIDWDAERQRLVSEAAGEKANWLDDVIAGLMINGVTKGEIEVRECPEATRIAVRGVERYEFKIKFTIGK